MKLIDFYRNEVRTNGGYLIEEILTWGPDEWEASHEEIQWLFPTVQKSVFNPDAPTLTEEEITLFKNIPELQEKFRQVIETFLGVFGLQKIADGGFDWRDDLDYDPKWWFRKFNHNYLRMTRVMDCLSKMGRDSDAFNLFLWLCNDKEGDVSEVTKKHWKDAALGKK